MKLTLFILSLGFSLILPSQAELTLLNFGSTDYCGNSLDHTWIANTQTTDDLVQTVSTGDQTWNQILTDANTDSPPTLTGRSLQSTVQLANTQGNLSSVTMLGSESSLGGSSYTKGLAELSSYVSTADTLGNDVLVSWDNLSTNSWKGGIEGRCHVPLSLKFELNPNTSYTVKLLSTRDDKFDDSSTFTLSGLQDGQVYSAIHSATGTTEFITNNTQTLSGVNAADKAQEIIYKFTTDDLNTLINITSADCHYTINAISFETTTIPEPSTASLGLIAIVGLLARRKRRS